MFVQYKSLVISNGTGKDWIFSLQQLIMCHVSDTFIYNVLFNIVYNVGWVCIILSLQKGKLRPNNMSYLLSHTHTRLPSWERRGWDINHSDSMFDVPPILSQVPLQNSLIHAFKNYLLSTYYGPDTMNSSGDTEAENISKTIPASKELTF